MRTQLTILTLVLTGIISMLVFQGVSAQPSFIPVEAPVSNANPLSTPAPDEYEESTQTTAGGPPLSLSLSMLCLCLVMLLIIGIFVLGVAVRTQNHKDHVDDRL